MARIPVLAVIPPVIFAGLAGLFLWGMNRDDPAQLPTAFKGRTVPEVALVPLPGQGEPFTDATLHDGAAKLVNFWASWCAPCRVEHPNLSALAEIGVPIYGINYKDDANAFANATGFLAELGNPYQQVGADPSGRMALDWGLYGVPETFVVDGKGTVILRFAGPITRRVIDEQIRPALAKAGLELPELPPPPAAGG
ncbi:DsbE family thiol:disulfide interchange protein [Frigidibacter sp. MR17.14]|uniref:DsbE family thiol:disulfide interchange protein n=1 Tax=Frigidibacter sp. MR17.14 TaxID=3126509 RepID=UPI003012E415